LAVHLGGGSVVTLLDGQLLGDQLLGELDRADTDGEDRDAHGGADQRRVQAVHELAVFADALVLPGPPDVDAEERGGGETGDDEPDRHGALRALLRLGARGREAPAVVRDIHAVEVGAERDQLVLAHLGQFLVGVVAVGLVVAHERAPIHSAAPTAATMPTAQITPASAAGPNPPSANPPGLEASVAPLT